MANRPRVTRESVAYQRESYVAAPRRQQPDPLHVVNPPSKRPKPHRKKRRGLRIQQLACCSLAFIIAGTILFSHMKLTQLTDEASSREAELEKLQSEYVALKAKQDRALSLSYVEDYAQNKLGMVKMDNNQIEYVEMNNPDRIEISEPTSGLGGMLSGLIHSFNAIVEYIR